MRDKLREALQTVRISGPGLTAPVPILDKHIETILDAIVPVVDGRDDDEGVQK